MSAPKNRPRLAWQGLAGVLALALALAAALAVAGCGGDGIDAPESPAPRACRRVDERLGALFELVDQGKLSHLRRLLGEGLAEDARRDLVAALLRLVAGFEEGTFAELASVFGEDEGGRSADLEVLAGRLVRWLAVTGPAAPYPDVLAAGRGLLNTCEGPPSLTLLADLVADEPLRRAVLEVLGSDGLREALAGLSFEGTEGREATRLLVRNLMVAASGPDFDLLALVDLLAVVVDLDTPPWPELVAGLERHLGAGPGLAALQELLACALAVDPDASLGPLLWDLLVTSPVGVDDLLAAWSPAAGSAGEPPRASALAGVAIEGLRALAADAEARRALVTTLTEALREEVAPGVLEDVADLLEAGVLGDVLELLAALATGSCR